MRTPPPHADHSSLLRGRRGITRRVAEPFGLGIAGQRRAPHRGSAALLLALSVCGCSSPDRPRELTGLQEGPPPTGLALVTSDGTTYQGAPATILAHPAIEAISVSLTLTGPDGQGLSLWADLPQSTSGSETLPVDGQGGVPRHAQLNVGGTFASGKLDLVVTSNSLQGTLTSSSISGTLMGAASLSCVKPLVASSPSGVGGGGAENPGGAYVEDTKLETEFCRSVATRLGGK